MKPLCSERILQSGFVFFLFKKIYDVNQDPIDDAVTYAKNLGMTHVTSSSQL